MPFCSLKYSHKSVLSISFRFAATSLAVEGQDGEVDVIHSEKSLLQLRHEVKSMVISNNIQQEVTMATSL